MKDLVIRVLLAANAVLLAGILCRSLFVTPAQAQSRSAQPPAIMQVADGTVYILQNGKLSIYWYDPDTAETNAMTSKFTKGKLRLLTTQEVK